LNDLSGNQHISPEIPVDGELPGSSLPIMREKPPFWATRQIFISFYQAC
jgi:hypothetical protein